MMILATVVIKFQISKLFCHPFRNGLFIHVKRFANKVAHHLTKGALLLHDDLVFMEDVPMDIHPFAFADIST